MENYNKLSLLSDYQKAIQVIEHPDNKREHVKYIRKYIDNFDYKHRYGSHQYSGNLDQRLKRLVNLLGHS